MPGLDSLATRDIIRRRKQADTALRCTKRNLDAMDLTDEMDVSDSTSPVKKQKAETKNMQRKDRQGVRLTGHNAQQGLEALGFDRDSSPEILEDTTPVSARERALLKEVDNVRRDNTFMKELWARDLTEADDKNHVLATELAENKKAANDRVRTMQSKLTEYIKRADGRIEALEMELVAMRKAKEDVEEELERFKATFERV